MIVPVFLLWLLLIAGMPTTATAADIVNRGTCGAEGNNLTWTLDSDGKLIVSGKGDMGQYPWWGEPPLIKNVEIRDGVTSIGNHAFDGCSNLASVTIPNSVTSIEGSAFVYCRSLAFLSIPDSVTSIGSSAFNGCRSLTSITIPDSVTSIESYIFSGCSGLISLTIPENVTSIESNAFYGCSGLISFTIPEGVTSIESSTFNGCSGLTSITIPNSVTSIGSSAFNNCNNLINVYYGGTKSQWLEIAIDASNTSIQNAKINIHCTDGILSGEINNPQGYCGGEGDGSNLRWIFTDDGTLKISGTGKMADYDYESYYPPWGNLAVATVFIENGVTTISGWAFFRFSDLVSITIPDSIITIGERAFARNSGLTNVVLPNSVTAIGEDAFMSCGITSMTIPDNISVINSCTFWGCSNLTSVTIPSAVVSIDEGAFAGCYELTDIYYKGTMSQWNKIVIDNTINHDYNADNVPLNFAAIHCADGEILPSKEAVVAQGYCGAEAGGRNLQWILSSDRTLAVKGVGAMKDYQAFYEAFGDYSLMQPWYDYDSYIKTVVVENGVTSIGNTAFGALDNMTSVIIPESVTVFGSSAFSHCDSLVNINLPNGITSISDGMFGSCNNLTSVIIPNGVSVIEDGAFQNCYALSNVTIPYGVISIGAWAFRNCDGIASVTIPDSVTTISHDAFEECDNLSSVMIGKGITSIASGVFEDCENLKKVIIPMNVTDISQSAFRWCPNVILCVYENSYAHNYAMENELAYEFISDTVGTVRAGTTKTISVTEKTCDVTLDCSIASVSAGTTYQVLYALCDEHGQMLSVGSADVTFDADTSADFTVEGVQAGVTCRIFLINNETTPQCAATQLTFVE